MTTAFDRLDPSLQYQIAYGLGFSGLRPVQELTVDAVLGGANTVVLAPTAGGKTEAAFFPLLSSMISESWAATSVLYLTPIKALLNNQEERLEHMTRLVGRRAAKWHGDVTDSSRKRILAEPVDVLLTTPESLEAMLISRRVAEEEIFANLRAVVIDEVHAFAGDDRGGHLACVLERLTRICGRDLQRIGLSATVGNPTEILEWLQGSSGRPKRLVDPPKPSIEPEVELDFVGTIPNAALMIERLHPGKKRLVFCDSRRKVEEIGRALDERGVRTFVMHSSLSAAERQLAEREFGEGSNCVIVATSAMELGIDVGDLDHVLQIDSPSTVASFLQRMGRTGRRAGTTPNCTVLCTTDKDLLQAAGLLRLWRQGFIEPVRPAREAAHLYAHQVLALALQHDGVPRDQIDAELGAAPPIVDLSTDTRNAVLEHMLEEQILFEDDGRLVFGPLAERLYGAKNFLELYAVFESTQDYLVAHARDEIGRVSAFWASQKASSGVEFTLGGKPWKIRSVNHARRRLDVERGREGGSVAWLGSPLALGFELCRSMHDVLRADDTPDYWTQRATDALEEQRDAFHAVPSDGFERTGQMYRWHTYAGGRANAVLEYAIDTVLSCTSGSSNLFVEFGPVERVEHVQALVKKLEEALDAPDLVLGAATGLREDALGKFRACLPEDQRRAALATRFLDVDGAHRLLSLIS